MNFIYPLGLLGLIGVPILIIIYIIKNKYTEKTIASTYIWTVSERFLKRKRPISQLVGLISLILQILAVVFLSFAIAHPIIVEEGKAHEYCFILDASGSMQTQDNGVSRFATAKEEIETIIKESLQGSYYTLITVDNGSKVEYKKTTDKQKALDSLALVKNSACAMNGDLAMSTAQEIFDENSGAKIYLVTDKSYESVTGVEVINVAKDGINYSVAKLESYEVSVENERRVHFKGELQAYGVSENKKLRLDLYLDGALKKQDIEIIVSHAEATPFVIETDAPSYQKAELIVKNEDNLSVDNTYILYNIEKENLHKTLIVSETGFFFHSFVEVVNATPDLITPKEYADGVYEGYDLYIFDCYSPKAMPQDGAVWFIAPPESIPDAGFAYQGDVNVAPHVSLEITDDSSSTVQKLLTGISNKERVVVTDHFKQYGTYRNFITLYSYKSIPMIFTGVASTGYREVVFSFDIHNSNLPVLTDCPALLYNLWNYSFPDVIEKTVFESGESVQINALPGCSSIRVDGPDSEMTYLEIAGGASVFTPTQTGEYLVTMKVGDAVKTYNFYSILPESERAIKQSESLFEVRGEATEGGMDGIEDIILIAFIVLIVMFVADWMVYCYDKYQLR